MSESFGLLIEIFLLPTTAMVFSQILMFPCNTKFLSSCCCKYFTTMIEFSCLMCVSYFRLCVERILIGCLVPVSLEADQKMKRLLHIYCKLDDAAVR